METVKERGKRPKHDPAESEGTKHPKKEGGKNGQIVASGDHSRWWGVDISRNRNRSPCKEKGGSLEGKWPKKKGRGVEHRRRFGRMQNLSTS